MQNQATSRALRTARRSCYADGGKVDEPGILERGMDYAGRGAALADLYSGGMLSSVAGLNPFTSYSDVLAARDRALEGVPADWKGLATQPVNPVHGILFGFGRRPKGPGVDRATLTKEITRTALDLRQLGHSPDELLTITVAADKIPDAELPKMLDNLKARLRVAEEAANRRLRDEMSSNAERLQNAPPAIAGSPTPREVVGGRDNRVPLWKAMETPLNDKGEGPFVPRLENDRATYVRAGADPEFRGLREAALTRSQNRMERDQGMAREAMMDARRREQAANMTPEVYAEAVVDGVLMKSPDFIKRLSGPGAYTTLVQIADETGATPLQVLQVFEQRGFDLSHIRRYMMQGGVGKPYVDEGAKEAFDYVSTSPILYRKIEGRAKRPGEVKDGANDLSGFRRRPEDE